MITVDQTRGTRLSGLILGIAVLLGASPVSAQLAVTPITWDVVGLDSNRPLTSGPELFPVGAEVCSAVATTGVTVDFFWPDGDGNGWDFGTGHPHINLRPGSLTSLSFASIGAGECVDAYFELKLNRSAAAFGQSREYLIQASDGVESASSPDSRAIHVEYLVSQNRNTTSQIRYGQQQDQSDWVILGDGGSINLAIDQTYFIELTTQTSTAYEELQSFVTLSNTIFQVVSVSTTYSNLTAPPSRVPVPNPRLWADGCLWDSDLDSPNYLSCLADGKAGGVVVTTYEIRIISTGGDTVGLEALIYDRSGGSYHYNTDYSESPGSINTYDPTDSDLSKRFVPDTIGIGGASRLRFTISNPNPIEVSGYNFIDNLPAGLEVASPPNAATTCGGIWNPLAADTVLAFDGGTIVANGTCTILVDVTAAAAGTYDNTSNNLLIGTTDTGNNATASLVVSATPPPVVVCDDLATLALWQFPIGSSTTAPVPTSNLVVATAAAGSGLVPVVSTQTNDVGTGSWGSDSIATGALVLSNNEYFEFVIDTTGLDSVTLDFAARRTPQGPQSIQLYYGPVTGTEFAGGTYSLTAASTWFAFGPATVSANLNPSGTTRFRLYAFNSGNNNNGHSVFIDAVRFRGLYCGPVTPPPPVPGVNPPQISKSFSPNPIGIGHQSTLTFLVDNPNPATALSGITVSDELPAGLAVVPGTFGGTCTGYWALDPSDPNVLLHSGGTLPGGASCTLSVDVIASTVGTSLNISDLIYATESGYNFDLSTGVAQSALEVLAPPTIVKDFDPNLVLLGVTPGDASVLTFTIGNPNAGNAISGVSFTDTFPAGLVVATPPNASTSGCGTPVFAPAGGDGALSFSAGSIIAGGSCVVAVDVTGPAGVYPNTSSPVSHIVGGLPATNGQPASDTVEIDQPIPGLAFVKQIGPGSDPNGVWSDYFAVGAGNSVYYKITVENTGEVPLTGIAVTDPSVDTTGCTWPLTLPVADAAAPTAHIAECVIGPVTAITGTNTNTASVVTTEVPGPTTDTATYASAELDLLKTASPLTYTSAGEVISYNFTVTNSGAAILAGPVVINDPLVPGASCPPLSTIGNNDNFFDPLEAIVCTGSYTTQASDVTNLSITNTAQANAGGFDSPTDSATVTVPVPEPTIAKSFATDPIAVGGTSALTITVTNNSLIALTGVSLSDTLPAGLSFAAAVTSNTCGGTATVNGTFDTLTLAGGTVAASGSCTVTIDVNGDVAGNYTNTTSVVSSDQVVGTTTGSDTLGVTITGPTIAKSFVDSLIGVGETTSLTITATNTAATALSNVGFSDALPAGLLYAGAPSANTCGGTATVNAGNDTLTLAGGAIAASGSCSVTVDVTGTVPGNYTNTTSVVTSDEVNGTTTGSDTLQVEDLPTITKLFADDSLAPGDTTTLTITVTNNATIALTNASFVDQLPVTAAGELNFVAPVGGTCGGTPVISTTVGTDDTLTVTGFGLAAGASCTVTVDVQANAEGSYTNTTSVVSSNEVTGTTTGSDTLEVTTASLTAPKADTLIVDNDGDGVADPGDTIRYAIVVTNGGGVAGTNVAFSDTPDVNTALVVGSVTTTQGSVTSGNTAGDTTVGVSIGTLAVAGSVTITFDVTVNSPFPAGITSVANQGLVTGDGGISVPTDDPDTGTADDPTVTPVEDPSVNVTKADVLAIDADGDGFPSPGDTLEYTVEINNTGNMDLTGITFSDTPDANTALVVGSVTTTLGTVTTGNTAGDTSVSVDVGTVVVGATATVTFRVTIDNPLPVGVTQVSNQGTVTTNETPDEPTDDPDTVPDDDPTNTTVTAAPVIDALKADALHIDADGSGGPSPGDTLRYTVVISNTGNTEATSVFFIDPIPTYTTVVAGSVTTSQGTVNTDDPVDVTIGDIAASATVTITFDVLIEDPLPGGVTQIANQGTVSSSNHGDVPTDDPDTPAVDDPTLTPVAAEPIIEASKTDILLVDADGSGDVSPGDTLSYTVAILNTGNTDATGVVFTDPIPVNTSVVAGSVSTSQGTVDSEDPVQVTVGTIAAAGSVTISFHVVIDNPLPVGVTEISNQGTVSSNEVPDEPTDDPDTVPDDDPTNTPVNGTPDLSIVKDDGGISTVPGGLIAYTLSYANNGNQAATGVVLTETVPASTIFNAGASTAGWVCVPDGNAGSICTLAIGALAAGGSGNAVFAVTVNNPVPVGFTQVVNNASIADDGANGADPNPGDNSSSDTTPVVAAAAVAATKADSLFIDNDMDGVADPGDTLRYTVVVSNSGTTAATSVVFSDTPGVNTALVVGSVTTSQGAVTTGNTAGDTTVGVSIGTLAAAGSVTITFDVTVNSPFPAGVSSVANQGLVTGDGGISVPTDDPDTGAAGDPTVTPVEDPGVEVTKADVLAIDADGNGFPSPGDTLEYTVEISNTGNIDLTGITFSDTPDANTALVVGSVTTTQGTVTSGNTGGDSSVSVDVGTVAVGTTATITFRVTIDNPLPVGVTQVSNQGTVTTNETPDEPTNDPDTVPDDDPTNTTVTAAPVLDAEKADALHVDADGNGIPSPGDTIRYTVVISNTGNTEATSVFFIDPIPTYTTVVAGSVTTTQGTVNTEDPVDVTIGDIAASATVTITFDVLIDNPLPGGVTELSNQGTVSAGNHGDVPTDDPDTPAVDDPTLTPLIAAPVIEATKVDTLLIDADGSGDVSPGDTLSYSVTINNTGNTEATGVVFTDPIPANTSVVAGSVTTSQGTIESEDPVQVTVGTIAAGGSVTISFHVVIDNPLPAGVTEISNQGTVSSNEVPDEPTDDPDTVPDDDPTNTPVNSAPDLSIVKDDGGISTVPGGLIAYTLGYANNGNQTATGVTLTDTVPANTIFNSGASTAGWVCVPDANAGSLCSLDVGTLAVGGTGSATFAVVVLDPVPTGFNLVVNNASIADDGANGADPNPGDNSSSDTTPVVVSSSPSLDALKSVELLTDPNGNNLADPGELLRYTVTVINDGDTVIENVVLRDTPDEITTLVVGSVTTSHGTITVGNGAGDTSVEVVFGDLAVGQTVVVVFDVIINNPVPPGRTHVSNQGVVSSDTIPDEPTNDPDTSPDDDPTLIRLGDPITGIPDLGGLGRLLFMLILAMAGAALIRRRLI